MISDQEKRQEIHRLQHLLDVYGGDRDRWPMHERLSVAELIAEDTQAQKLVRDAQLLDRLIEGSHLQVSQGRRQAKELTRLSDRILAQARADGRQGGTPGGRPSQTVQLTPRPMGSRVWQAAGLMAACLIIGIMVGQSGLLSSVGEQAAEVGSADSLASLLPDEALVFFGEEDMI